MIKCCICSRQLESYSADYLCELCEIKYSDKQPPIQKIRKRKKYDDENNVRRDRRE